MRVLVTGATGFIGRALARALLASGHHVRAAARDRHRIPLGAEPFIHGSIEEPVFWADALAHVDAVVHLAALAHTTELRGEIRYDRVNRIATESLVNAAREAGVKRFVFISSIRAQTGPTAKHVLTELDAAVPTDAYGRAKLAAEHAVRASGIPATILRPVLVYGPELKGNLATLLRLADLPFPLPLGTLDNVRSLVSLDNVIAAIDHCLHSDVCVGETFIVSDPEPIAVRDIIASFRDGIGRRRSLVRVPRWAVREVVTLALGRGAWERLAGELVVNPAKLMTAGWTPRRDTARALREIAARTGGRPGGPS